LDHLQHCRPAMRIHNHFLMPHFHLRSNSCHCRAAPSLHPHLHPQPHRPLTMLCQSNTPTTHHAAACANFPNSCCCTISFHRTDSIPLFLLMHAPIVSALPPNPSPPPPVPPPPPSRAWTAASAGGLNLCIPRAGRPSFQ
jgi:hypothetical protein